MLIVMSGSCVFVGPQYLLIPTQTLLWSLRLRSDLLCWMCWSSGFISNGEQYRLTLVKLTFMALLVGIPYRTMMIVRYLMLMRFRRSAITLKAPRVITSICYLTEFCICLRMPLYVLHGKAHRSRPRPQIYNTQLSSTKMCLCVLLFYCGR